MSAAIAQAAHDTLVALFRRRRASFDALLADDLGGDPGERGARQRHRARAARRRRDPGAARRRRLAARRAAHRHRLHSRATDAGLLAPGSDQPAPAGARRALGRGDAVRARVRRPVPRAAAAGAWTAPEYAAAFNEVKRLGGDGITTPTARTAEQTHIGIYWAYDGTPSLCAPPRLYNQIAVQIADADAARSVVELARLLALVNVAMADAGIAIWESKYFYEFWRPVTGIREADPGTGPDRARRRQPATIGDPTSSPLGAPASNLTRPELHAAVPGLSVRATPPSAARCSRSCATFYGTRRHRLHLRLRRVQRRDARQRRATSGRCMPRSFASLSQAEEENGQSRIYLGIHWAFDKTVGIAQGAVSRTTSSPTRSSRDVSRRAVTSSPTSRRRRSCRRRPRSRRRCRRPTTSCPSSSRCPPQAADRRRALALQLLRRLLVPVGCATGSAWRAGSRRRRSPSRISAPRHAEDRRSGTSPRTGSGRSRGTSPSPAS